MGNLFIAFIFVYQNRLIISLVVSNSWIRLPTVNHLFITRVKRIDASLADRVRAADSRLLSSSTEVDRVTVKLPYEVLIRPVENITSG